MAELRAVGTQISWTLTREELVGRSSTCDWQLTDEDVSAQHAALRWTGKAWELQDLGSRNGTFVRGQRLVPGLRVVLVPGMRIRFGTRGPEWVMLDASPPRTVAIRLRDGKRLSEHAGTLALPSSTDPRLILYQDEQGAWLCEDDGSTRALGPEQTLIVNDEHWRVRTEEPVAATYQSTDGSDAIEMLHLHFRVSADEEHVELSAGLVGRELSVPSRAHHYLLLVLARCRLADMQQNPPATAAHGWVHQEQLSKMLRKSSLHINVEIYRARQQFAELGFAGAPLLVERRRDTGEIRLGCSSVVIDPL